MSGKCWVVLPLFKNPCGQALKGSGSSWGKSPCGKCSRASCFLTSALELRSGWQSCLFSTGDPSLFDQTHFLQSVCPLSSTPTGANFPRVTWNCSKLPRNSSRCVVLISSLCREWHSWSPCRTQCLAIPSTTALAPPQWKGQPRGTSPRGRSSITALCALATPVGSCPAT